MRLSYDPIANKHGVKYSDIRKFARENSERHRITSNLALEFYGIMPNTNQRGWYFYRWIDDIKSIMWEENYIP